MNLRERPVAQRRQPPLLLRKPIRDAALKLALDAVLVRLHPMPH